jgi:hypothetical protein
MHGGGSPAVRAAAAANLQHEAAERALAKLGVGQGRKVIDPADAMLDLVHGAAANVEQYEQLLAQLRPVMDRVRWSERDEDFCDGLDAEERRHARIGSPEADSLVLYLEGRQSDTIAPHTLVDLYNAERAFLLKACVDCRRLGVDERRIEMSEQLGRQLGRYVRATVLATLGLVREALVAGMLDVERLAAIETVEAPPAIAAAIRQVRTEEAS